MIRSLLPVFLSLLPLMASAQTPEESASLPASATESSPETAPPPASTPWQGLNPSPLDGKRLWECGTNSFLEANAGQKFYVEAQSGGHVLIRMSQPAALWGQTPLATQIEFVSNRLSRVTVNFHNRATGA